MIHYDQRRARRLWRVTRTRQRILLRVEELEPRLAPAVNLTYADLAATPPLTAAGITGYLASVISTNYTLRAENAGGKSHIEPEFDDARVLFEQGNHQGRESGRVRRAARGLDGRLQAPVQKRPAAGGSGGAGAMDSDAEYESL